ncbi:MAG: LysR family transcriptional regulator [Gammaproteobacteria bacterium]|nr:LysR family transcriptional regulator [Gammaproteobacteria bacterium]
MFLELRHLRTLTALRDFGNLAAAAQQLYQTQSALSHQLKAIENYYSAPLFVRKSKPLRFTPLGERLLQLADEILPAVQNTEQTLQQISGASRGRLHIAIECHACFDWLIPTMDGYRKQWSEVEMDLSTGFSFEPIPALARGRVDVVITSDPQELAGIDYVPLFRYQALLVLANNHPLTAKKVIEPEDLRDQTLITYPVERTRLDVFNYFLIPAGVEPALQRTSELTVMILQLVASERGVAALPNWVLTEYLNNNYVSARPLGKQGVWSTLYAAVRKNDRPLAFVDAFLQRARETAFKLLKNIEPVS